MGSKQQIDVGSTKEACARWVSSLNVCISSNLVAAGLGDGSIRLIKHTKSLSNQCDTLNLHYSFPIRGFVNGLKLSRSSRFIIAGIGQEPRFGRWAIDNSAKNFIAFKS